MADDSVTRGVPQFGTAEYRGEAGVDRCKTCGQAISGSYYRVNGAMTCSHCLEETKRRLPQDSHAAFMRGLLFGGGGAVLGLILYAAFAIITGWMIGYVSLAVGYVVGKAVNMGSQGLGGRRYQMAAALLTYAAVSMAAVPIAISQIAKQPKQVQSVQTQQQKQPGTGEVQPQQTQPSPEQAMSPGKAIMMLVLVGLASPFLELQNPLQGLIGLVILMVGIRIAWRMTAGMPMQILGPFNNPKPASS